MSDFNDQNQPEIPQVPPQPAPNTDPNAPVPGMVISIVSLVTGIIGLAGMFITKINLGFLVFVFLIVAVVTGIIGRKESPVGHKAMATIGMILGIIGLVFILAAVLCVAVLCSNLDSINSMLN